MARLPAFSKTSVTGRRDVELVVEAEGLIGTDTLGIYTPPG